MIESIAWLLFAVVVVLLTAVLVAFVCDSVPRGIQEDEYPSPKNGYTTWVHGKESC